MSDEENKIVPQEIQDVLNTLPSDDKEKITKSLSIMLSSGVIPRKHPFENILNEAHLSKIIDNSEKDSERDYQNQKSNRRYIFATFIFGLLFILGLIYLLNKNPELLMNILMLIGGLVAGTYGGYGTGYKKGKSEVE